MGTPTKFSRASVLIQTDKPPVVELDSEAHAAYVRFSRNKVASTKLVHSEQCIVTMDVDAAGVPIGIELIGVDEFGVCPLLKKAGMRLPKDLAERARYVPANLVAA